MFLICGEALFDVFIAGETATGLTLDARIGGSPYNVAVGLARLGQPAGLLTGSAPDALGERLVSAFRTEGVETRFLVPKPALTTLALVGVKPDGGARYSFYARGSVDAEVAEADLPDTGGIRGVHFGSYSLVLDPTGASFLTLARRLKGQALITLDPNLRLGISPDIALWRRRVEAFVELADLVKVSDEDLAQLYPGRSLSGIAADWLTRGPRLVVVTRGAEGAFALSPQGSFEVPGEKVAVVDTVGAGDTFQAALLMALSEMGAASPAGVAQLSRDQVSRALAFAARAAAITVTRRGADLPRRSELPVV